MTYQQQEPELYNYGGNRYVSGNYDRQASNLFTQPQTQYGVENNYNQNIAPVQAYQANNYR
jgi:hypothetical protein